MGEVAEQGGEAVEFGLFVVVAVAGDEGVDVLGGGRAGDAGGQGGLQGAAVVALQGVDEVGG
ncbi:hypothetical protein [Nocardiopsis sp. CNR-923]|uniref:hypothetical protein n=1 Tax=Nocardiopsis sp. CNR-923 TaxID=1904965 RepID=UPI00373FD47E